MGAFAGLARAIAAHQPPPQVAAIVVAWRHLRDAAAAAVPRPGFAASSSPDYAAILQGAALAARNQPTAGIAAALPSGLPWHYSYPSQPGSAALAERIAFAELIGPIGPLFAPDCRVGFTLMAADTLYPLHAHPAVELYLVIAGHAEWSVPGSQRIVPPGDFVLHHEDQPHQMRSFDEPLLALYGWQGDITTPPRYLSQ
jgi:quercetin dioxygenase-like cupin family protein